MKLIKTFHQSCAKTKMCCLRTTLIHFFVPLQMLTTTHLWLVNIRIVYYYMSVCCMFASGTLFCSVLSHYQNVYLVRSCGVIKLDDIVCLKSVYMVLFMETTRTLTLHHKSILLKFYNSFCFLSTYEATSQSHAVLSMSKRQG